MQCVFGLKDLMCFLQVAVRIINEGSNCLRKEETMINIEAPVTGNFIFWGFNHDQYLGKAICFDLAKLWSYS